MSNDFTYIASESIWDTGAGLTPADALQYLNDPSHFRPFSEGLTMLITNYGYKDAPEDIEAKTKFISEKLTSIGEPRTKSTITDWFTDKRRPRFNAASRKIMFQLCFALSASFEDVQWFFSHVYFDRVFNCHTVEEAVYYYCFSRRLPYRHAQNLLHTIRTFPVPKETPGSANHPAHIFTDEIRNRISRCANDDEFLRFFQGNLLIFDKWNQTALSYIGNYLSLIQGKPSDKAVIEAYKAGKHPLKKDVDVCGLIIQEYLSSSSGGRLDYISGKKISSIDFMLERMILTNSGFAKDLPVPDIVRRNFPSKKTFSDILNKAETSTSYDSLRKCLILLKFYHFWITLQLHPEVVDAPSNEYFDIYCDETNALLIECGHEELFAGNPYDWLFLWAATAQAPLAALRNVICTLEESAE